MIYKKKKMTIPEYRENKELFELLGYHQESYKEKGFKATVILSIDETDKHYLELRELEKDIFRKGPPFFPIIAFVSIAFTFLSIFVVLLANSYKTYTSFDLVGNALGFLLPAFAFLFGTVIYTYFYFKIHRMLIEKGKTTKDQIKELVEKIKSK